MTRRNVSPLSSLLRAALLPLILLAAIAFAPGARAKASAPQPAVPTDEAFVELCGTGAVETVRQALKNGANANAEDDNGSTALMQAARGNSAEVVRALVQAGAEVNAQDGVGGWTPLMQAAAGNGLEVIRALLEAGAQVNVQDDQGGTALIQAARYNRAEVVSALLAAGADKGLKTHEEGHDALWFARESARQDGRKELVPDPTERRDENQKVIELLQGSGAKP